MSDKVKERIRDEAKEAAEPISYSAQRGAYCAGYIRGAETERPKAWNEALDEAIKVIRNDRGIDTVEYLNISRKLESLKHIFIQ